MPVSPSVGLPGSLGPDVAVSVGGCGDGSSETAVLLGAAGLGEAGLGEAGPVSRTSGETAADGPGSGAEVTGARGRDTTAAAGLGPGRAGVNPDACAARTARCVAGCGAAAAGDCGVTVDGVSGAGIWGGPTSSPAT